MSSTQLVLKERIYVGHSRARDLLIVCGDPQHIEDVGGPAVLKGLGAIKT